MSSECVQNILSKKLSKGQKASDQDLAIAHSECEKTRTAKLIKSSQMIRVAQIENQGKLLSAQLSAKSMMSFFDSKKRSF